MPLCDCIHEFVVNIGGNVNIIDNIKTCENICTIKDENDICDGSVIRFILETKKNMIKDGRVRHGLFTANRKCPKKLSVLFNDSNLKETLNKAQELIPSAKIIGYVVLPVSEIKQFCNLNVKIDNYSYSAKNHLDLHNHCSISAFSGKNLKDLQQDLKIHINLAKISSNFIPLDTLS